MKLINKFLLLPLCCATPLLFAGCNNKSYGVYTNIPENGYAIIDKTYNLAGFIEGYSPADSTEEIYDTAGYTQKTWDFFAMTANAQLCIYSDFSGGTSDFNNLVKEIAAKLYEIEKSISSSVHNSDIFNFNAAQPGEELKICRITYDVLSEAKAVYDLTEGYYNPALYYNVQAYGFGGAEDYPKNSAELPSDAVIAKYTALATHFGDMELREDEGEYFVTKPDYTVEVEGQLLSLKLDLGGIGKGYAVDCVDSLIDEYGFGFGYFNFGTSSMLVKNNVGNGNFSLGLSGPRSPSRSPYLSTSIRNEKLSTSGDNEQYYIIDGTRYCHIIDPTTGKPIQTGIMSVTVIGGGAAEDDALTTAIMCMGKDKAIKFIEEKLTDRRVVFTVA